MCPVLRPTPASSVTSWKRPASLRNRWLALRLRQEEVAPAVAVVVADGDAHAVGRERQARFLGDVREVPLAVVAVQGLRRLSRPLVVPSQRRELARNRS